jgi:hypothetical protein
MKNRKRRLKRTFASARNIGAGRKFPVKPETTTREQGEQLRLKTLIEIEKTK